MYSFFGDKGPQLATQGFVCDQIDPATKKILKIKLCAKVAGRGGRGIKCHQDIHITVGSGGIARGRSEQGQIGDAETPGQFILVLR